MVRTLLLSLTIALMPVTVIAQNLPAAVCQTVRAVRGSGPITSAGQLADMLNEMAWKHRADGWGVSTKRSGNRCQRFDGQDIACDILHHRPTNQLWDVFVAAGVGERTEVTCSQMVGLGTDPNRPWMAPIEPKNGGGGGTDPKDEEIAALKKQLAAAQATISAQAGRIQGLESEKLGLEGQVNELNARVASLESERDELKRRVEELENQPAPTCRATLSPGWVGRLGIRARCEVVR